MKEKRHTMEDTIEIPRDATVCDLTIAGPRRTGSNPWLTLEIDERSRHITAVHLGWATGPTEGIEAPTTPGAEQQAQPRTKP